MEAGVQRIVMSLNKGASDSLDADQRQGLVRQYNNFAGALGELAVAKHLGLFWSGGLATYKAPDVGGFQVRTNHQPWGDLIVRAHDPQNAAYILVTCDVMDARRYVLRGWLWGAEAQRPEYWRLGEKTMPPAYFVPQAVLRSMSELHLENGDR